MIDNNKIVEQLRRVKDPKSGQDIVASKMVEDLKIDGQNVSFSLVLSSNDARLKQDLNFLCMQFIQEVYPTANVHIHIKQISADQKSQSVLPQVTNVIAVASGKGGVGKSTVSVNLAVTLAKQGFKVGLLDADVYGPSIPTMFGLQGQKPKVQELYGKHKLVPLQAHGVHVMSIGFIVEPEQAIVLRGPRLGGVVKQFIQDCLWPELDYLIIDLPPGTGDVQLTLVQTIPVTGAVVVTTPQEVAYIDAIKAMNMFLLPNVRVPILGVVENMAWFTPEELPDNKYYIFGKGGGKALARKANCVLLGQVPLIQGIREGGDDGTPLSLNEKLPTFELFQKLATNFHRQVNYRNLNMEKTQIVTLQD